MQLNPLPSNKDDSFNDEGSIGGTMSFGVENGYESLLLTPNHNQSALVRSNTSNLVRTWRNAAHGQNQANDSVLALTPIKQQTSVRAVNVD